MQRTTVFALSTLALFATPADDVHFAPDDGSEATKHYVLSIEMSVDEATMTFDGDDIGGDGVPDVSVRYERRVQATDRYERVAGGRPLKLARRYDALTAQASQTVGGGDASGRRARERPRGAHRGLHVGSRGRRVRTRLARGRGARRRAARGPVGGHGPAHAPAARVRRAGATWELDADDVLAVLVPGGDLKLSPDPAEGGAEQGEGQIQIHAPNLPVDPLAWVRALDGGGQATYEGQLEVDGVQVAVVSIAIDVTAANDLVDYFSEIGGGEFDSASLDVAIEADGELLWDLERGRVHALALEGDVSADYDITMSILDGVHTFESSQQVSGDLTIRVGLGELDE